MQKIMIGSARIDENGNISGGAAGDQKQTVSHGDTTGEVSQQAFYAHKKGWMVIRAKISAHRRYLAKAMIQACDNPNIGYNQSNRGGILKHGTSSTVKTECDCSSTVRQCVKEATGVDAGNFTTLTEKSSLMATGLFDYIGAYKDGMKLEEGDILCTLTKGHTVIVTSVEDSAPSTSSKSKIYDNAKYYEKSLAGTYKVTASTLNLRSGEGTDKSIIGTLKKDATVKCHGYYNVCDTVKWYLVESSIGTGYASSKYLKLL